MLKLSGLLTDAKENRTDLEGDFGFARSLPLEKALHPDTLIAYALNGKPIPLKQGYPLRLIVPQLYAMASVKWLRSITVIRTNYSGPFQDIDYVFYPEKESDQGKMPVTTIHVNSIIQQPLNWSVLKMGMHRLYGLALSGTGFITNVEISVDGGKSWRTAAVQPMSENPYSWTSWSYIWVAAQRGEFTIKSRATDSSGCVQSEIANWNRKGFGYNAWSTIQVKVE